MKGNEFPRDFKHKEDGKTCRGRYKTLRAARVPAYENPDETVTKYVLELDLEPSGETVSYWLGDRGKLVSDFQKEIAARKRLGRDDFDTGELIEIVQSDEQRPSRTSGLKMWDYRVAFEHAAPPPSAADVLLGGLADTPPAPLAAEPDDEADAADDFPPFEFGSAAA